MINKYHMNILVPVVIDRAKKNVLSYAEEKEKIIVKISII